MHQKYDGMRQKDIKTSSHEFLDYRLRISIAGGNLKARGACIMDSVVARKRELCAQKETQGASSLGSFF
jgi:hypothetical protein